MTRNAVTLEISRETAERLDALARRRGMSRRDVIEAIVTQAVESETVADQGGRTASANGLPVRFGPRTRFLRRHPSPTNGGCFSALAQFDVHRNPSAQTRRQLQLGEALTSLSEEGETLLAALDLLLARR